MVHGNALLISSFASVIRSLPYFHQRNIKKHHDDPESMIVADCISSLAGRFTSCVFVCVEMRGLPYSIGLSYKCRFPINVGFLQRRPTQATKSITKTHILGACPCINVGFLEKMIQFIMATILTCHFFGCSTSPNGSLVNQWWSLGEDTIDMPLGVELVQCPTTMGSTCRIGY